jgi:hypothetical protein
MLGTIIIKKQKFFLLFIHKNLFLTTIGTKNHGFFHSAVAVAAAVNFED